MADEDGYTPDLQPGGIWTRDGESFIIDQCEGLTMKDADDAQWKAAISYRKVTGDGPLMVRSQADFRAKFKLGSSE